MFGREKTPAAAATKDAATPAIVKEGGKGRATPTRREAELRNRRPLIGAPPPPKGATREERKANRAARQAIVREDRARSRAAMANGDERYLPARDKGASRRFVRDYVDSRRNLGELFLPIALGSIVVGLLPFPGAHLVSLVVLYVMVVSIAIDSYLLRRRAQKLADAKFGDKAGAVGTYALMRALQFRRGRMPKPQVQRGEFDPTI